MTATAPWDGDREVLTFVVAGERLALPAGDIEEIVLPRPLTRVPRSPASMLGVANLRGAVLPVLSLARIMDREPPAPSSSARIVVVNRGSRFGLSVDSVSALTRTVDGRLIDVDALMARDFGGLAHRVAVDAGRPAARAADPAGERSDGPEALELIAFLVGGQEYALPLDHVAEILAFPAEMAALPRTDEAMIGVTAVRGRLLPLVSLSVLLGVKTEPDRGRRHVVVTRLGGALAGLVVDGLRAILRVPPDSVDPMPPVLTRGKGEARIEGICRLDDGRRLVSILSPAGIFDRETTARIMTGAEPGVVAMSSAERTGDDTRQFVVFTLADEHYGLPIACVDEVVRRPDKLTRAPLAPAFVAGLMNLRGRVIPVIDQHRRFEVEGVAAGGRIVVVTTEGLQAGFVVDAVSEVLTISSAELNPAPELTAGATTRIFDRIATMAQDNRMILLIDPKALLDQAERDVIAAIAANAEGAAAA